MVVEMKGYVMKQLNGDTLTPIAIYEALQAKQKVLFESNAKFKDSGRYSFIALDPIGELKGGAKTSTYKLGEEVEKTVEKPVLTMLKELLPIRKEAMPFAFFGGVIGYFGYETAFHFEQIGEIIGDVYNMPDVHVFFYDTFIVMDHLLQQVSIVVIDLLQQGRSEQEMLEKIRQIEAQMTANVIQQQEVSQVNFEPTIEKQRFIDMVETAKDHIRRGDIFQVVLSQTFEANFNENPFALYRKLRTTNPSPYMFYMDFGPYTILGTSPESLVKVQNGIVTTNPIAGTKPRGKTSQEDEAIAQMLLQDAKEIAEHKMLVDLGRNDVGRVSKIGTVEVKKYMQIEKYKYVMHIVSEVIGTLRDNAHLVDVLASSLPAGTVSGAPKIRAMQIINALEKRKRGIYAGAIGYLSTSCNMDLALAIRTMIVKDGKAYVQAGAGIVYDSVPESEYEETLNKAKALLEVRK
ncbi:anthranilate synthase component I [Solibacillus sp. MA9]|uniref:Anthranilate synthase component 1 n=1 Tax=Solibacillus palustris TaxID=2908203 RepID=A0ABS9UBL4_9BACL|nr:anthranilate synthase component I [Solibacillus sp. MA9]MCH7321717.1 anthranilate synthase component I [Solibacillus sp. MA9]